MCCVGSLIIFVSFVDVAVTVSRGHGCEDREVVTSTKSMSASQDMPSEVKEKR